MNLALVFTVLRIVVTPLFPLFYIEYQSLGIPLVYLPYILLSLLVLCECSDLFDGFLARRWNQVTDLGKILDPVADSIMHISLFLTFTQGIVQLSLWYVFVFLYRDMLISTLRTVCALRGIALAARFSGKMKTVIQAVSCSLILCLMIPYTMGWISLDSFQELCRFFVGIAAGYTILSVIDYVYANRLHIRKVLETSVDLYRK